MNVGVIDAFETVLHLANPTTSKEAVHGFKKGLMFRSGKEWTPSDLIADIAQALNEA